MELTQPCACDYELTDFKTMSKFVPNAVPRTRRRKPTHRFAAYSESVQRLLEKRRKAASGDDDGGELQATSGSIKSFSTGATDETGPSSSPPRQPVVPDQVVKAPPGLKLDDGTSGRMVVIRHGSEICHSPQNGITMTT